jgi:hypothetical protein
MIPGDKQLFTDFRVFLGYSVQHLILYHEMGKRHLTHPILVLSLDHLDITPGLDQVGILQLG